MQQHFKVSLIKLFASHLQTEFVSSRASPSGCPSRTQPQLSLTCTKASTGFLVIFQALNRCIYITSDFPNNVCPCLSSESMEARQRSYELGIHLGYQRRNKEVIAWVKKRRRTIRREDLISFLCGKVPPPRTARAPPRVAMVSASRPAPPETDSSVETDLQPFREAIALHGKSRSFVQFASVSLE